MLKLMNEIDTNEVLLGCGASSPRGDLVMRKTLRPLNQIDSLHDLAAKCWQLFLISRHRHMYLWLYGLL